MNKVEIASQRNERVLGLHQADSGSVTVMARFQLHQRKYERLFHFSAGELEIDAVSWAWLYPALQALAHESQLRRVNAQDLVRLRSRLKMATSLPEWHSLIASSPESVGALDVAKFFHAFDHALEINGVAEASAASDSINFRRFILRYLKDCGVIGIREQVSNFYSPQHSSKSSGRKLISDLPWPGRPPLSAIPHGSYAELKSSVQNRLKEDLDLIVAACCDVLNRYEAALDVVNNFANAELSGSRKDYIIELLKSASLQYIWSESELQEYLCLRAQESRNQSTTRSAYLNPKKNSPPNCLGFLRGRLFGMNNGTTVDSLLKLDVAPPGLVLLACALILQRATHWNFISVLELESDQLDIGKFPHRIQSLKPKTADETPIVWIERTDVNVIRAFRILCERRDRLIEQGSIAAEDRRVWFSSKSVLANSPNPLVSFSNVLSDFVKIYKLPKFSLEQMRVQCLATVAAGVGGLNEVVWSAGHSSHKTSLHYIDKLLIQRLLDASNLEFEWRLEATVKYMMDGTAPSRSLIAYPIGDGTSCSSPENPPNIEWLASSSCTAINCDAGGGCKNRRIYINELRVEEVVRLRSFYLNNWRRLFAENPIRFERLQIDQMMFNYALYGVLKRGPYRHLVSKYESASN